MLDFDREREETIRRQVTRRIQRRMLLVLDYALLFFYGMIISGRYNISEIFPMFGSFWFMAAVVHTVLVVYWEWSERAVHRALEQERNAYYRAVAETVLSEVRANRDYRGEKPKRDSRDQRLRLNTDGELLDIDSEDDYHADDTAAYRKRR